MIGAKNLAPATLILSMLFGTSLSTAGEKAVDLKVGDPAPQFQTQDDDGRIWNSSDYIGKQVVVVYFYPADMTPGCTKQACGFRDDMKKLSDTGVKVVGVSGDSVRNHQLFKKYHELNFTLLTDIDGSIATTFGVPHGKGGSIKRVIDDKEETLTRGITAERWTFVFDKQGKLAKKYKVSAPQDDSKSILQFVAELK